MIITANDLQIEVREGTSDDVPLILSFVTALAEFEHLKVVATEEVLRNSLFGQNPPAFTLLAFVNQVPVACVIYFFTFSTLLGKRSLWLEDLYVKPEYRSKGIGRALLSYLANIAVQNDCGRFEWAVLDWNTNAIKVYQGFGAKMMDDWRLCRVEGQKLKDFAQQ
jgi:GNAT superfamily N-acetyltransferase